MKTVATLVANLIAAGARSATKFVSEREIVRATRRSKPRRGNNAEFIVTIGRPNHAEREFIKRAKKAGGAFPIRKVRLKYWPAKKRVRA